MSGFPKDNTISYYRRWR